jgi:ribosomal protein L37E
MPRQERCPQCGSKKFEVVESSKKCKTCGFQWSGTARKKTDRKEKVRF